MCEWLYWKKLKSWSKWQVIEFDAQAFLAKIVKPAQIVSGTEAGKCKKITDQVRLIEVTVPQRELSPVGRRSSVHLRQDSLKPLDAIEKLWF
jgi:hypothetical protein